jgi:hypothetical protein
MLQPTGSQLEGDRMNGRTFAKKPVLAGGFGVLAVLLAVGSVAWACTVMSGNVWLCAPTDTTKCAKPYPAANGPTTYKGTSTAKSAASGLYPANATFDVMAKAYSGVNGVCHDSNAKKLMTRTASSGGWFSGAISIKPPLSSGQNQMCAKPTGGNTTWSNHWVFTVN